MIEHDQAYLFEWKMTIYEALAVSSPVRYSVSCVLVYERSGSEGVKSESATEKGECVMSATDLLTVCNAIA